MSVERNKILYHLENWVVKHTPKQLIDWPFGYQLKYCWSLLNEYREKLWKMWTRFLMKKIKQ